MCQKSTLLDIDNLLESYDMVEPNHAIGALIKLIEEHPEGGEACVKEVIEKLDELVALGDRFLRGDDGRYYVSNHRGADGRFYLKGNGKDRLVVDFILGPSFDEMG
jgi:hypothetical protein